MKAKIKIIIDAGMMILVLIQMAYHLIGDSLHGWIGMILFVFISRKLPQRMFLMSEYVFFDYDELILFCLIDHTSVLCLFAYLTYCINAFFRKAGFF